MTEAMIAQVPRCRSCGALILWARTTKGKRVPIDAGPVENGNIRLAYAGDGSDPVAHYEPPGQPALPDVEPEPRYVSHFATCPQAREWRNP